MDETKPAWMALVPIPRLRRWAWKGSTETTQGFRDGFDFVRFSERMESILRASPRFM